MSGFPRTYRSAVRRQLELRDQIVVKGGPRRVRRVAGADISYDRGSDHFFAAVVVLSYPDLVVVEEAHAEGKSPMPYIPGLLSFREGPLLLRAFKKLRGVPDLVLFDGHGLAHPRRFGVACHLGLLLDLPSIGCGKSRLVGEHDEPGQKVGDSVPLKFEGRRIGSVVRTRPGVKPLYVSPGHRIGFPQSVRWVLGCCAGYRQPEPTRWAHRQCNDARNARRSASRTGVRRAARTRRS
ncbi:MAG: deoxyribonuclease V [Planctomycetota bacterium]|jgi:deoxyribonuclease V